MSGIKILVTCLCASLLFITGTAVSQTTIQVGVASMITPVSAVKYYQQVVDYYYDGATDDRPLNFRVVDTPEKLQQALMAGTKHILIVAHLNTTGLTPVEDLPREKEGLDGAIARVLPSTLTVAVRRRLCWCLQQRVVKHTKNVSVSSSPWRKLLGNS